jgi:hypothetical protein
MRDDPMNLRQRQRDFAHALRHEGITPPSDGAPDFEQRFDTYRNNAWQFFATALEQTYPVMQRRVGSEYFRQLAREYRLAHPSRCGDLHSAGADFAAWLDGQMTGSGYEWLADLARLEWAVADAAVAAVTPAAPLAELAAMTADSLADLRLSLQPSVRLIESAYPVWSVWQANQREDAEPVDLAQGGEHCVIACLDDRPIVYRIDAIDFRVLERLARGETLGEALDAADAEPAVLGRLLGWAFAEQLVAGVVSPSVPA